MTKRSRSLASTLLAGVVAVFVLSVGPLAAAAGAADATPTLTSATVDPGHGETVSGGGCAARVTVQVKLDGVVLVTTRSLVTGRYSVHLVIPVSAAAGPHRVTVVCAGPSGAQVSTDAAVSVNLPNTGSSGSRDVALALIATGAALMFGARRRTLVLDPARVESH
jgi:hypothetical protein